MRILALSNCVLDANSGSGQTRLAWAEGLRGCGHEVRVLDTHRLQLRGAGARLREVRLALGATPVMWRTSADLVECYGAEFGLAIALVKRRPRSRRAMIVHHSDGNEFAMAEALGETAGTQNPLSKMYWHVASRLRLQAFKEPDGYVCATQSDAEYARQRGWPRSGRIGVVPLGLRSAFVKVAWKPSRAPLIVFAGSWTHRKGVDVVVRVCSDVLMRNATTRLAILGCGGGEKMASKVRRDFSSEIRARVDVVPELDAETMSKWMGRAAVGFFPSRYEGFGLALAEAMACGCACVTTTAGLGGELNIEEAVVCAGGDTRGMAAAILRLLEDGELRERMGRAAVQRTQLLRWELSVQRLNAVYREWLEAFRRESK